MRSRWPRARRRTHDCATRRQHSGRRTAARTCRSGLRTIPGPADRAAALPHHRIGPAVFRALPYLVPTFRSSCSVAAPTFTNFGKSWAPANLLILVPLQVCMVAGDRPRTALKVSARLGWQCGSIHSPKARSQEVYREWSDSNVRLPSRRSLFANAGIKGTSRK